MQNDVPYLTIALTNRCNFRCFYCSPDGNGGVGEGFGTRNEKVNLPELEEKIKIAESTGIKKIRITGGEPLLVDGIMDLLCFLESCTRLEYALATNGSAVHRYIGAFRNLARLDLRVSLDTLDPSKFKNMCGVDQHNKVISNIEMLSKEGILKRVAAVMTDENIDEIDNILDFCERLHIGLKVFDMYSTPETKERWKQHYAAMSPVIESLQKRSLDIRQINYTRSFGIPSLEYILKSGIVVRVKDSRNGTRYSKKFCDGCRNSPCQEGMYTILYSSDNRLIPCRLSHTQFPAGTPEEFRENLKRLIKVFQDSYHENQFWSGKYGFR